MKRMVLGVVAALVLTVAASAEEKGKGGFVHVVVFTLKKDTPASAVDEVIKDCRQMLGKISVVRGVKAGRPAELPMSKGGKKDYDVGLLVLVDDAEGLKSYIDDPLHVAFVKKHQKLFVMEKLRIFDFTDGK